MKKIFVELQFNRFTADIYYKLSKWSNFEWAEVPLLKKVFLTILNNPIKLN